jgi:lipopolysaccharide/colanic/teichoic acid biosynthesis glycosyltransferase
MLINVHDLLRSYEEKEISRKLAHVLSSSTREIDIKGWHKSGSVIGIIFLEINGTKKDPFRQKIYDSLGNVLDSEQLKQIKISLHVFPEEKDENNKDNENKTNNYKPDLNFYSDLSRQHYYKKSSLFIKRTMDVIGGILGIIIFSPFFLIIPILIKFSMPGPVFFKQERIGQFGKRFSFVKFRTMNMNNDDNIHKEYIKDLICDKKSAHIEEENGEKECIYKLKNDPRVTSLGRFLRKSSLDELPQFFNVLKSDMSLVGPRPPIPYELEHYNIWHRRRALEVKPGITGIWQVKGRSSTTFDEMVRMDINYLKIWSFWLDIKILLKTPWAVLAGKGAH